MAVHALRDTLLSSLSSLPGTRHFHIHVLVSSPRKHASLFPYAHPRPKVYLQDVFVLLSEQAAPGAPRALVTAIEAQLYNLPATSCGILYIQKVDATGQGTFPSPTSTLVRSFVAYYADPATRPISVDTLWIQLFARAQGQYLFPNSSDFPGKKPLSDVKLCAWWKRIFSEVAVEVESRLQRGRKNGSGDERDVEGAKARMQLFYLLPGFSELEAQHSLKLNSTVQSGQPSNTAQWIYGHQYSQTHIPLPCPPRVGTEKPHLGHVIPWFDDDPKSRFMDDLAHNTETNAVKSPKKKKPKTSSQKPESTASTSDASTRISRKAEHENRRTPTGELNQVGPDEFWERMSFRQECVAGAVTGFFTLGISISSQNDSSASKNPSVPSPLAPQAGQVSARLVRRVVSSLMTAHEFSTVERAIHATETLEESIKGLCDGIATVPVASKINVSSSAPLLLLQDEDTTHPQGSVDPNPDSTVEPSKAQADEEAPISTFLDVPRTPPRRAGALPEISPNPFPEPVASMDTYHTHIYGSIAVNNPALSPRAAADAGKAEEKPVTMLTVRKKKRKVEA
ncbi:hypothetical protein QCA50_007004 [Cerrena zonata]|uniref:histone acetyltransferase n=1 Tax=Cerrena zonata TaxID=2478898 RepID=A0AAW0GFA9_9APHY